MSGASREARRATRWDLRILESLVLATALVVAGMSPGLARPPDAAPVAVMEGYTITESGTLETGDEVRLVEARGFEPALPRLRLVLPAGIEVALRRGA